MRIPPSIRLTTALIIALLAAGCGAGAGPQGGATSTPAASATVSSAPPSTQQPQTGSAAPTTPPGQSASAQTDQTAMLQYLIEEEKLAHDVYQRFAQLWGGGVFDNIQASEVTHQDLLLPVLQAKGIPDPRTSQPGTFRDQRIQQMYNQLTQQGSLSITDAYKAGVTIEEQDIADLQTDLKATTDPAIVSALQRLLAGSQNHLQSFKAHLG